MKNLVPNAATFDAALSIPEDAVDDQTAASLEPAFQKTADSLANLNQRLTTLSGSDADDDGRLAALEQKVNDGGTLEVRIDNLESTATNHGGRISSLEAVQASGFTFEGVLWDDYNLTTGEAVLIAHGALGVLPANKRVVLKEFRVFIGPTGDDLQVLVQLTQYNANDTSGGVTFGGGTPLNPNNSQSISDANLAANIQLGSHITVAGKWYAVRLLATNAGGSTQVGSAFGGISVHAWCKIAIED